MKAELLKKIVNALGDEQEVVIQVNTRRLLQPL